MPMSFMDILSVGAFLTGLAGTAYTWRQHESNKELSFPSRNAHRTMLSLRPFSQEIEELVDFLGNNIDRKVYLSLRILEEDANFFEDEEINASFITIKYQKLTDFSDGEQPTDANSLSLTFNVEKSERSKSKCYSYYGVIELRGYFIVRNSGGPRMGGVWVTLSAAES